MRIRSAFLAIVTLLVPVTAATLNASTIVISQGDTPGDDSQPLMGPFFSDYVETGWTTGSTGYSNVNISATLSAYDSGGDVVDAYLSTSVGSGAADPIAMNTITVTDGDYSSVLLFSGLSLDANTSYYLTLAPEMGSRVTWGIDDNQPTPVTDLGVVALPTAYCSADGGDCDNDAPPSSYGFTPQDSQGTPADPLGATPIFSVTADNVTSSTPEPVTFLLAGAGVTAIGLFRRKRT